MDRRQQQGFLKKSKDEVILYAVPHYRTDLILRKINLRRYDDRDFVSTNLIETYERIMAFVAKHLPDPFYLEGDMRISIRDTILREVASNILIHREYTNLFPAKLILERGQVRTENSDKSHGFGLINPETFSPFPKNPVIALFFREIGRADELGSGVRRLMKYGKAYGGSDPELLAGDVFRIVIKTPEFEKAKDTPISLEVTGEVKRLLNACRSELSRRQLQDALGLKGEENFRNLYLEPAMKSGLVEMTIPHKPTSRLQKYRLTSAGKHLMESIKK